MTTTRKFNKNEFVNVLGFKSEFLRVATIVLAVYEKGTHNYKVECIKTGNHSYVEEERLTHFKIDLNRENPERMTEFYEALGEADIEVQFDHHKKKKTYTLIGPDLDKAKDLFQKIVIDGNPKCPDCGHYHGNER